MGFRGGGHGGRGARVKMEMRRKGDKIHGRGVGRPSTGAAPNDRRKTHNSRRLHPIPSRMRELAILIPNQPSPPPLPAPMADAPPRPHDPPPRLLQPLRRQGPLPPPPRGLPSRRRCGSSHGWLAITDESPAIFLLNPLTRAKVLLPPLSSFSNVVAFNFYDVGREYTLRAPNGDTYTLNLKQMRDFFIKKVILSSSPSSDDNYIAFAILNQTGDLAFCKNGDQSWKFIEDAKSYCEDVIYCNGLFYAVNKLGEITVCDVHGPSPRVSLICTPPQIGGDMQYVVSSSEELLLITRYLDFEFVDYQFDNVYKTMEFRAYRLDLNGPKWERVMNLGDKMLFLGENSSLALSATDFPGCKGNCIYYTDDYSESNYDGIPGDNDLGVYDLEDGSIEPLPCYPRNSISQLRWPPPIWVTPNPY
ncbi:hypothetical protein Acr_21g0010950 [Actinidia rufa]|uniref:KIB1-4 beta-propeller domain-containing protein n=1 Tax=Actinidia rufa TaxID=165716 RepID=A0A7J0GI67_9ERIC|nr:hypothetical protein Acr_21g0010950 [Actinidia rufa]